MPPWPEKYAWGQQPQGSRTSERMPRNKLRQRNTTTSTAAAGALPGGNERRRLPRTSKRELKRLHVQQPGLAWVRDLGLAIDAKDEEGWQDPP